MRLPAAFHPVEHYQDLTKKYRLLPFRFMRWSPQEVLVVNDVGEYVFLKAAEFERLVSRMLGRDEPPYLDLRSKHFICDSDSALPLQLLATKYRTKKFHLAGFTKLHMFVVTLRCDHSCKYCQVSRATSDPGRFDMTPETARMAMDLMFRSPSPNLKVEFQGGEPLLNFDLVRYIVEEVRRRNEREGRHIEFVIATNLVPITDDMLAFMREQQILLSTSLDGPEFLHNGNRPRPGRDSYARVLENIHRAREAVGHDRVSALMTTTERSLKYPGEIIDEYVRLGFDTIFLRPISPYGFAIRTGEAWRYQMDRFLEFYTEGLDHVIELNRQGIPIVEVYAQILLTRILTPWGGGYIDLQSPAGAVIGAVAYNYDGRVYASDESRMLAEMGDESFCLGTVDEGYEALFGSATARALATGSVLESLPGCSDCAFLPFCGADPVFQYRTQGDVIGHKATSPFCQKNMTIIRHLLEKLRSGDEFVQALLTSWGTGIAASPPS
jgi:His-Xaa-Ser system radical SAM maturase HxsB